MKRAPTSSVIFLLLMCISHSAAAEAVRARIVLESREASVAPSPVYEGDHVLAPLGVLESLGASYSGGDEGQITVTGASGRSGEVETVDVNGASMIPMDKVMEIIGGESNWNADTHTLTLTPLVKSVEFVDGVLKVNCSFPVAYTAGAWGGKVWVDIASSKLATETGEVYIGASGVTRARMAQYTDTTVRVALDLEKDLGYRVESKPVTSQVLLRIGDNLPNSAGKSTPRPAQERVQSFKVNSIRLDTVDEGQFNLVIGTSGKGNASADYGVSPPQVVLRLKGGTLAQGVGNVEETHPLLKQIKISRTNGSPSGVRIALDLTRIAAYNTRVESNAITLTVRLPEKASGLLSGKFIVVDPGHGGSQKGAQSVGVFEKDVNFKIAAEVAAALEAEGAKTMLTRSGDTTMGLSERSEVAIYNKADFFISVHCNSNGVSNSANGIETYYHMQEGSSKALAYAVHAGVCTWTGMCDRGPRSDRVLYSSGLAVLRRLEGTSIPGLLLECGYMNSTSDRAKLFDNAYRKKLAEGVVAGFKAYVEGTPISENTVEAKN